MMTTNYDDWREVPNTGGRYKCNSDGDVLDLSPRIKLIDNDFEIFIADDLTKMAPLSAEGYYKIRMSDGKKKCFRPDALQLQLFPELYAISRSRVNQIKRIIDICRGISYDIDEFNRLIFPNKLINLYDKGTDEEWKRNKREKHNWLRPRKVPIEDGRFTLYANHNYFGLGTRTFIHIKDCYPVNSGSEWWGAEHQDASKSLRKWSWRG